jgi:hypothetical protein
MLTIFPKLMKELLKPLPKNDYPALMGLRHFRAAKKAQTITGQRVNLNL